MHKKNINKSWYPLDTSAKIYPAIESSKDPAIFRISMTLTEPINDTVLLEALENIRHRFPYYNVHLKKGLFWNYLQKNDNDLIIWSDTPSPCGRMYPILNNGFLYKIKYYKNNIALEMFHVLTDGFGGLKFLNCLIHQYLFLLGKAPKKVDGIVDISQPINKEEYEDAFLTILEREKNNLPEKKRTLFSNNSIYQITSKLLPKSDYKVITGIFLVDEIKKTAKKHNATITEYLSALYLEALIHLQVKQIKDKSKHKDVAVQIPVNMRKYYPLNCMRNFSLFVIPQVNPRNVSNIDEILSIIKSFIKEHVTQTHLLSMIDDNCSLANHQVIKFVPIDLKNLVIGYINNTMGSSQFSGTISNYGIAHLPEQIKKYVKHLYFITGPSPHEKCTCGIVGYEKNIYLTFGRSIKEAYIEKYMFTHLVNQGVHVKIKSN